MKLTSLANRNLLLGVSGSIAAYKACELLRLYQKHGAFTRVIMTKQAQEFVTPLTMQSLSGNEVHTDLVDYKAESAMGHIQLARWADCLIIAPASAAVLARLASGSASDLLSAVFLATASPRIVAPAMNKEMWAKQATQKNLAKISKFKETYTVQPGSGWQACGEIGDGRLAEPVQILEQTAGLFSKNILAGRQVLITAGPTREPLDQARFISNYSSGKMGYALARAATEAGAKVTLISGPTACEVPAGCSLVKIETAQEMLDACTKRASTTDVFIATAAVADWRPKDYNTLKIKKAQIPNPFPLVENPDILAEMGPLLPKNAIKVGFAAEASNLKVNATAKLKRKNVDLLCANLIDKAFGTDDNHILMLFAKSNAKRNANTNANISTKQLSPMSKNAAARIIVKEIAGLAK